MRLRDSRLLKVGEKFCSRGIEVSVRHGGISFSLSTEKSPYVSAVFLKQAPCAVFRMTLEVHEETAFFLFHKQINARIRGLREHLVTAGSQRICSHFIPPGMWNLHHPGSAVRKRMVPNRFVLKYAELFVGEPVSGNAIAVENASMRRQA